MVNDRYKLDQFYEETKILFPYLDFQALTDQAYNEGNWEYTSIALDVPAGASSKRRKEMESKWLDTLPELTMVKALTVNHRLKQDFFDAVCRMPNLEQLFFHGGSVENIATIAKLSKLKRLTLKSFTQLTDISPLASLKNLTHLSIDNCFKVQNYEIIGKLTGLLGLELCGDTFAPKKLRLNSLKPFTTLKHLKHLDLSAASVIDGSYACVLEMDSLERLDLLSKMPGETREKIKSNHKNLKAGFFVDYDFEKNKFYEGKNWDTGFHDRSGE